MKTFEFNSPMAHSKRHRIFKTAFSIGLALLCLLVNSPPTRCEERPKSLAEFGADLSAKTRKAYDASPFMAFSRDYFARIIRDPEAKPAENETAIDEGWKIYLDENPDPLVERMAAHLSDFFVQRMDLELETVHGIPIDPVGIVLSTNDWIEEGASDSDSPEDRFQVYVKPGQVFIYGKNANGVRDGVVKLVDRIGFRQAPFLEYGFETFTPRLRYRLGSTPWGGDFKDLVFMGYNTVFVSGGNLHALSKSDWIPELKDRQNPALLDNLQTSVRKAKEYGLRTFAFIDTRQKYPKDHPVFKNHPEIRGALTWKEDGEYVLCTEHPLVQRYLRDSVKDVFEAAPDLDGITVIIGGEGFYHCFMRPFDAPKGHTNCERCEAIGAETVVANLCNLLAESAREVNPEAIVAAWPYSAAHVWSADEAQVGMLEKFGPGTALLTEIEKDEFVKKGESINKHLWDYSIDLIGPGEKAKKQIEICNDRGIPVFLKSEPELSFEAPRLSHIPCMDRWWNRAEALASCGATGAFVFPAFRPNYGSAAAEVAKYCWWKPDPTKDETLMNLAARIAGEEAAPDLRKAWAKVSEAIPLSPELPPYYTGPYYLGPMHPMCADRDAELPDVFMGYYLFYAEMTDEEGLKPRPTYFKDPRGDVKVFADYYRRMEKTLAQASEAVDRAEVSVPPRLRVMFLSEATPIRFFYRTARTHANFYESCILRDRLNELANKSQLTQQEDNEAAQLYDRWLAVLRDEKENTEAALPLMKLDVRLDPYYGSDHSFSHGVDMIEAKLDILQGEIENYLPSVKKRLGMGD